MTEDPRARNERLMRAYLERELQASRDFLEERVRHLFTGALALLNPVAHALWHALGEAEIRRRIHRQFDVLAAAARLADSDGLEAAVARWWPDVREHEEIVHRGRRDHPRFPEVERVLHDAFRRRVDAVRPVFGCQADVADYDALVRAGYPDRDAAMAQVARDVAVVRRVVGIVRAEPDLLRFPRPLLPHLFRLIEETSAWYEKRAEAEFARIYAGKT